MHAFLIEAVPALPLRALAESSQVLRAVVAQEIVLARAHRTPAKLARLQQLLDGVEFVRLRQMLRSPVCKMNSGGLGSALMRLIASWNVADHILVRRLVEADVAVADLHEIQLRPR